MGDVIDIRTAKKRRPVKASEKAEQRMEDDKIDQASSKYGQFGTESQKRKTAWMKKRKPEVKDDESEIFTY